MALNFNIATQYPILQILSPLFSAQTDYLESLTDSLSSIYKY